MARGDFFYERHLATRDLDRVLNATEKGLSEAVRDQYGKDAPSRPVSAHRENSDKWTLFANVVCHIEAIVQRVNKREGTENIGIIVLARVRHHTAEQATNYYQPQISKIKNALNIALSDL